MKIGITGAAGHLGRLIIQSLNKNSRDAELIALVRSPEKVKDLNIQARYFDYSKPETLKGPLQDTDCLMMISASEVGKRSLQHQNIIDAAKQAGVKRVVYTSLLHADKSPMNLAEEHRFTEDLIKKSGIEYTILRNGWYTENYMTSMKSFVEHGAVVGSAGDGKISSAARADYAEAAAAVLTSNSHKNKIYELAGDKAFTLSDLAAELSKQTGKNILYQNLPKQAYVEVLEKAGLPEQAANMVAQWDVDTSNGALYGDEKTLHELLGHETTPLAVSIENALK